MDKARLDTQSALRRTRLMASVAIVGLVSSVGVWGATADLDSAVIAPGSVVVENNVKKVQHPTGGIIGELRVKEGDRVEEGALLARLDDTATRANLAIIDNQLITLQARLARLKAERDFVPEPGFPAELVRRAGREPDIAHVLEGERNIFRARLHTRTGQKEQLALRISQLKDEITGVVDQSSALEKQLVIANIELKDLKGLSEKGLVQRPRVTSLQREILQKEGTSGELRAKLAQNQGKITETELQILQLDRDLVTEVAKEIREGEAQHSDLSERKLAAEDQLRRVEIKAPITGYVHQLAVHTVGGVVTPGEPLMMMVPVIDALIVEARVQPADIDKVKLGQSTWVRFPAFNMRTTPEFHGTLVRLSADTVKDTQAGSSYFVAGVKIADADLSKWPALKLLPGMPAEAYIHTGRRTMFQYLLKPFTDQVSRALRE